MDVEILDIGILLNRYECSMSLFIMGKYSYENL